MEINFETTKEIIIDGKHKFDLDISNLENIQSLIDFRDKHGNIRELNEEFIKDCKSTIDKIFGEGTYNKLFDVDTLKAYLLILKVIEVYQDEISKYVKDNTEEELEEMRKTSEVVRSLTEELREYHELVEKHNLS